MPYYYYAYVPYGSKRPWSIFFKSLTNPIAVACFAALYFNRHFVCSWEDSKTDEPKTVFTYFLGTYFSIHVITWYIVFEYFYQTAMGPGFRYLLPYLVTGVRKTQLAILLFEVIFGYWVGLEILGGWCDLERVKDCIQNDTQTCDSFIIRLATRAVQSLCERLTYSYDAEKDAYYGSSANPCVYVFRFTGHFLMTLLSSLFTFFVLFM